MMKHVQHLISIFGITTAIAAGGCAVSDAADLAADGETGTTTAALTGPCKSSPSESNCTFKDPISEGCSDDSFIFAFARDPGRVAVALRYSPSCQSAWSVAADETSLNRRVRASIVTSDSLGSARDGQGTRTSEMMWLGNPGRTVQGIGRLIDPSGKVAGFAQTAFIRP